ncbi:trehalose-phosphatase [Kytococcus sp. Marseille-QA3725]
MQDETTLPAPDQRHLAGAPWLVVATDFDGTLAPFEDDPMAVVPAPRAVAALRRLAALPTTEVVLVSGRDVQTLHQLSGLGPQEGVSLLGSHGGQQWQVGHEAPAGLDEDEAAQREMLITGGRGLVEELPGTSLEVKFAGVVVHTRQATQEVALEARAAVRRLARRCGVEPMVGKNVLEMSVLRTTKGEALRRLIDSLGEDRHHRREHRERTPGHTLWFAGDDVTDETVFRAFEDEAAAVLVKVGEGATAATSRVDGIDDVARLLSELADLREGDTPV